MCAAHVHADWLKVTRVCGKKWSEEDLQQLKLTMILLRKTLSGNAVCSSKLLSRGEHWEFAAAQHKHWEKDSCVIIENAQEFLRLARSILRCLQL